jgi:hypothetical protein
MTNALDFKIESKAKNITDLEIFAIATPLEVRKGTDKQGKAYSLIVAIVNGQEYRIPKTVIEQIQRLAKVNPSVTKVQVSKEGSGLGTKYFVTPLI